MKHLPPILSLSPSYPPFLREIHDPPKQLYVQTSLKGWQERPCIAIVGSRHPSRYGREVAYQLAYDLSFVGIIVVSGMAVGIDSCAHRGALDAGGLTIAVLGTGLDSDYPQENRSLRCAIEEKGVVMTEFEYGMSARKENFPQRNRIVSGLSLGVVVVEAAEKSGALITARHALEQNRQVFAVPGRIDYHLSVGPNRLIQEGAKLVQTTGDIFKEFQQLRGFLLEQRVAVSKENLYNKDSVEASLARFLTSEPVHIDELTRQSCLSPSEVATHLMELELQGVVRQLSGQRYQKV